MFQAVTLRELGDWAGDDCATVGDPLLRNSKRISDLKTVQTIDVWISNIVHFW